MISNMEKLYYLDDRPVTEIERAGIQAFKEGGKEAEMKVRDELVRKQQKRNCPSTKKLTEQLSEAKQARKAAFKKMCDDVKDEKQALVE